MMNNENYERCKAIAENLEQVASGDYFMYDGGLYPIDTEDFSEVKGCTIQQENIFGDIHTFYVMPDGTMLFEGDIEIATVGDYFNDFYDVDYVISNDKKYKACRVLVAFGGPNIYIDTWACQVQLEWWGEHAEAHIPENLCRAIDEFFEMLYNC